ncbi:hypothetical protein B6S12_07575 [Helicobacter valdiviensis]|uniref:Tyr recombinase domain-containing protein n=1 Tax=Helicobacter valdiviensis TaxID=1458358 RepID=A0A2W6MTF5_9HELI|nr:site-specific integrase [Helicobacter valdiviensis]PZT47712.1 hypothetical protein B6S12_07575 [Helicobacter valdiviensis]
MLKTKKHYINRGGKIHIQTTLNGERLRFSTKLDFNAENEEYVKNNLERILQNHLKPNKQTGKNDFRFYANKFLENQKPFIKNRTYEQYKTNLNTITILIKNKPIMQYSKEDVECFYKKIIEKNYSRGSVSNFCTLLNSVFVLAQEDNIGFKNPYFAKRIRNLKEVRERRVFSLEEVRMIIEESKKDFYSPKLYLYLNIAFFTGARFGEILALNYEDFNLEEKILKISKTLSKVGEQTPKTKTSNREIDILSPLLKIKHLLIGKGRIFKGSYYSLTCSYRREFKKLIKNLGMQQADIYATRHTFASLMLQHQEEPMWISQMLGHSNLSITYAVYAKFIQSKTKKRAAFLEEAKEEKEENLALKEIKSELIALKKNDNEF